MADVLIAALSPESHAGPLLAVGDDLVCRGHQVTVMTGPQHADEILEIGARHHLLPAPADRDDQRLDVLHGGAASRIDKLRALLVRRLLRPMPHQAAELHAALFDRRYDAVIADCAFLGVLPLLLDAHPQRWERPAVLCYSASPLMLSSRDTAPAGMALPPATTAAGRVLHRGLNQLSEKVLLHGAQRATNRMLTAMGTRPLPVPLLDVGLLADRLIMPTVPSFEYPRNDLPEQVRFVGIVRPRSSNHSPIPPWWPVLDQERPVVHVTQGAVDADPSRLIEPTITALADEDVTVVVGTGGRPMSHIRNPLPANTYVAEHLPHDRLLPKVDVLVTNDGYGAVQSALSAGVPVVVAGDTGNTPEVAARVAWSGAGINLQTGAPTPAAVRSAVLRIRADRRYLHNAQRLEAAFARQDGVAEIAALVDQVIAERCAAVARTQCSRSGLRVLAARCRERL